MEPRFTFISHGVGWKRDAILRRPAKAKTRKKRERYAILRSWRFGVGFVNLAGSVDGLRLAWASPLSRGVYRLFAAAPLTTSAAPSLRRA